MKYVWKDKGEGEEKVEIFGNYQKLKTDKMITIGNIRNLGNFQWNLWSETNISYLYLEETRGKKKINENENAENRQ